MFLTLQMIVLLSCFCFTTIVVFRAIKKSDALCFKRGFLAVCIVIIYLALLPLFAYSVRKVVGMKRTPRNYDGNVPTGKKIGDILPEILTDLSGKFGDQPHLILEAWPQIIGERIAKMSHAVSFNDGILKVFVKNSTLLSLLIEHEKHRLIALFQKKFPKVKFRDISFKIG